MKSVILLTTFILIASICIAQEKLNDAFVKQLDTIFTDDQMYRGQIESIQTTYANDSLQLKARLKVLWNIIHEKDSINQIKVKFILDNYGWLGTEIVGNDGNTALFMVIQHADKTTQEKYLPMMRDAVKKGNAKASSLALLEDRVAMNQGKKQIYGSQLAWNMIKNEYVVMPLYDPDNVDKRRAEVGLSSLQVYLSYWQLKWDVEQYKKDLPYIEAWQQTLFK